MKVVLEDFSLQYIQPYVMDWDESQHFPKEVLNKAGEYGFMGMLVPETFMEVLVLVIMNMLRQLLKFLKLIHQLVFQ